MLLQELRKRKCLYTPITTPVPPDGFLTLKGRWRALFATLGVSFGPLGQS
jgi:hypothetical protein